MYDFYLCVVMILAGIYELYNCRNQNNQVERICTKIIASCYFMEVFFYQIVKNDTISTIGCTIAGVSLFIGLFIRYMHRKKDVS